MHKVSSWATFKAIVFNINKNHQVMLPIANYVTDDTMLHTMPHIYETLLPHKAYMHLRENKG